MGATVVLYWGQLERENERIDDITARLEAMDAENGGRILASVTVYREVQQLKAPVTAAPAAKSIYVCATTRLPKRTFVVVDDAVTETSQNFETILGRLKSMYAVRQAVRIEATPDLSQLVEHLLGDFAVRLGPIVRSSNAKKGLLLEVEYRPAASLAQSLPIIYELLHQILPATVPLAEQQLTEIDRSLQPYKLGALYSHAHTICQYINTLRADAAI